MQQNNESQINNTDSVEVLRLPLWRSALEELIKTGVNYSQTIPAEWMEERLKCKRDSMEFGLSVSQIRKGLEKLGFYLSGRGQKGNQFVILPPASNADVMENYARAASEALKRGVILGTNTRLDTLTSDERRRHEGMLERMAIKAALLQRSQSVFRVIIKHSPSTLKSGNRPPESQSNA